MYLTVAFSLAILLLQSPLQPVLQTEAVPNDADDPAIWINPHDPGRSLILATDKIAGNGGVYSYGLDGSIRQAITGMDRPNNVDVAYGLTSDSARMDIAVVTERLEQRLRVFAIDPETTLLRDVSPNGIPVLEGQSGTRSQPMGIALYERPSDGAVFAIVAPKWGASTNYLWQYRLQLADGVVTGTLVRRFGNFSRDGEIEAIVVDDALGYVYYADERSAIHKWHADPDHPDASEELAEFGTSGYQGEREGLAIYPHDEGNGLLISVDQVSRRSRLLFYPREGEPGSPHSHRRIERVETHADSTDGIEVTRAAVPGFPEGFLVMMNSRGHNFFIFDWRDVAAAVTP